MLPIQSCGLALGIGGQGLLWRDMATLYHADSSVIDIADIFGYICHVVSFVLVCVTASVNMKDPKSFSVAEERVAEEEFTFAAVASASDPSGREPPSYVMAISSPPGGGWKRSPPTEEPWLYLRRVVERYVWSETTHSQSVERLGGQKETKTEYTYQKQWSRGAADSTKFKIQEGHRNPKPFLSERAWSPTVVCLGPYELESRHDVLQRWLGSQAQTYEVTQL